MSLFFVNLCDFVSLWFKKSVRALKDEVSDTTGDEQKYKAGKKIKLSTFSF
jgi:hypothetical protein